MPGQVVNIDKLVGQKDVVPKGDHLRELRCPGCQKLLLKEYIFKGVIEIMCHGCPGGGTLWRFTFKHKNNATM